MNSLSCVNECYRFSRCTVFFFLEGPYVPLETCQVLSGASSLTLRYIAVHGPARPTTKRWLLAHPPCQHEVWQHFISQVERKDFSKKKLRGRRSAGGIFLLFLKKKLYGLLLVLSLTARVGPAPREL